MDRVVSLATLLDYYGGLLTERQRMFAEAYAYENLSLYEIAEQTGVSRQAVRDGIVHAERHLQELEKVIGSIRRTAALKEHIAALTGLAASIDVPEVRQALEKELAAMQNILEDGNGI